MLSLSFSLSHTTGSLNAFHVELNTTGRGMHPQWAQRINRVTMSRGSYYVPWPIVQNPNRYRSFWGSYPKCS